MMKTESYTSYATCTSWRHIPRRHMPGPHCPEEPFLCFSHQETEEQEMNRHRVEKMRRQDLVAMIFATLSACAAAPPFFFFSADAHMAAMRRAMAEQDEAVAAVDDFPPCSFRRPLIVIFPFAPAASARCGALIRATLQRCLAP